MEEHIHELLQNTYRCRVKQVGLHKDVIVVERKRKLGVKSKFLGIFPIYEYERWTETLSSWTYRTIRFRNNFTGRTAGDTRIAVCYDSVGDTCYWRYI